MTKHGGAVSERLRGFSGLAPHASNLFAPIALGLFVTSGQVMARETPAVDATCEQGSGAFPAMLEDATILPALVVYRPKTLAGLNGEKLGVYIFGNGACSAYGTSSGNHQLEIAQRGYAAIAKIPE